MTQGNSTIETCTPRVSLETGAEAVTAALVLVSLTTALESADRKDEAGQ